MNQPSSNKFKSRLGTFVAIAIGLLATPAFAQWGGNQQAKLVVTEPVRFQYDVKRVEAVGSAEAVRSVELFPAAADEVVAVEFMPGQYVQAGQLLVRLDDRRQQVALRRAKLQLADAQRNYERLAESRKKGAIPQSELDIALTTRDLAQVTVEEAQTDLDDRYVKAPFAGFLGLTEVEVGDRITEQTIITTLDDRSQLFINFRAPEATVDVMLSAPDVTLEPWTDPSLALKAEIAQVDSRINDADRTLRARALLENADDKYRPGMSFKVSLAVKGEKYAAIPEAALLWGATGAYVWMVEEGAAKRVDVNVHQRLRGTILVSPAVPGSLSRGDALISEGIQQLRDGQTVTTGLARNVLPSNQTTR